MSLRDVARAWNRFFFEPQSPLPIGLFRIVFSLVVLIDAALLRPDWMVWFGPRGLVTLQSMQQMERGTRINLFAFFPQTDFWTNAIFWALVISAVFLLAGLFTRVSSVLVFLLLVSVNERNLFIVNSGDTLLRASAFFLMFAPAGAALSLDRVRNIWRGREGPDVLPRAPWAQRMIQIELCLLYFMTFWGKTQGPAWIDGTALYYVYHLEQFRRFPLPGFLQDLTMIRLETWATLAVEFSLGVLIWIKELRYPVLILGVLLHLTLEYSMNVPMFQWTALALYVTFIDGADLTRAWSWVRSRVQARRPMPVIAAYDPAAVSSYRAADVLRTLDIFGRLELVSTRNESAAGQPRVDGLGSVLRIAPRLWSRAESPRGACPIENRPISKVSARSGL